MRRRNRKGNLRRKRRKIFRGEQKQKRKRRKIFAEIFLKRGKILGEEKNTFLDEKKQKRKGKKYLEKEKISFVRIS